jgi:putative ATP-dependent endonuclease of OLD family
MKLRRIQIENFRGIQKLDLEIGDTTVLIGENNTGKTAVLDALRFALRDIRSRRGCSFDAFDFHLATSSAEPTTAPAIRITLTFREDVPGDWNDDQVARLNRAKILQADANGAAMVILKVEAHFDTTAHDFVQDWNFLNVAGAPLNVPDTAMMTLQNEVSYYYIAALRDAAKHFDAKGTFWRPFLKESKLTPAKRTEIEAKLSEVNELIISSHSSFSQVVSRLKEVQQVVSMVGGDDVVSVDAVPSRLFDMLAKAQVNLNTGTGAKVPVGRHGEGTQSLSVLTLFNAFLEAWNKGNPIVALEEPEAHLHPSAVRALWQLIERIPGQKIISTHSGDLLSEVPPDSIIRLARTATGVKAWHVSQIGLDSKQKRQFNFHIRHARGELLFARCWIMGEGETEVTLLPEIARLMGVNLEQTGVRCVGYRQADIGLFLEIADALGIQWTVITDNDKEGAKTIAKVQAKLNGRSECPRLQIMAEEDIEQHLCANGYGDIYEGFLNPATQGQITVAKTDPAYWEQVAKAVKKHKIEAVQSVIEEMRAGRPIPVLFRKTITFATNLSKSL